MTYERFGCATQLSPFIECYFVWDSKTALEQELVVESPPNSFCSIVFNYGDPYRLQNIKYAQLAVPRHFIAGQSIYSYKLFLQGRIGITGIVLKPAALATLFHLPAYAFTEERVDLFNVFSHQLLQPYIQQIEEAANPIEKVKALEAFLLHQVQTQSPSPDFIDIAANQIVESNGMISITQLVQNSCMSRRTFERRFFQKVGLSPKYYARIRRIAHLCNLIAGKQKVNWQELFYGCEYYDQAHFIKDFEEFTGRSPQQYLQENTELAQYVKKPQQQQL
ncbi:helix-turn-helix domain-containing protein [Flavisolibacter tropicus]|uniref:HTH araC/xylS-type domain-containing protein n=1 Tax=Flavisolibacter tropicus TaxID=1492898 RepID=A0A172TXL8_9BACT|nr:hypothetical protein SY85_14435 [Flavisolibacter tropicus]